MLYSVKAMKLRTVTTAERKRIRLSEAAARLSLDPAYLSRRAKEGKLDEEGLTVLRPYRDVVEFYEDELIKWFDEVHSLRRRRRN
jgi:hypothetical protein